MKIECILLLLLFLHQAVALAPTTDHQTEKATDVKDLALIVVDLILVKANDTLAQYGKLFRNVTDPGLYHSYGTCIEEFRGVVEGKDSSLAGSITGLKSGDYKAAKSGLQDTKSHVAMCLEGLIGRKDVFTNEAKLVDGLSSVAISIVDLLG
ncbi:hypothetical protein LINPERPRIM_LOCUS40119 [Linum perenne]